MGDRIHTLRKEKGLTLEYIGKMTGVAKSTVRKWESGDIASIRSVNLQKLADALGTTIEYLLEGTTGNIIYKNIEPIQSDVELLEEALAGEFDQRSSRSTILIAGRTPGDKIIVLRYGFWLALDLTAQV